jgi:cobalt/nickel transport system permease protein
MHIADAILSPAVCVGTGLISAGALAWSLRDLEHRAPARTVPLTGMLAALVFAGQMVNFPLLGLPVSGHLLGGMLAAAVVGPAGAIVTIAAVLAIQMLMFGDGGWLAYGANVLNMGVIGGAGGWAVSNLVRTKLRGEAGLIAGPVIGAWAGVMAASFAFCVEFALSHPAGTFPLPRVFGLMAMFHALIGVGEALITGLVVAYVARVARRPDLLHQPQSEGTASDVGRWFRGGIVAAFAVAAFAAPFASSHADGLEAVAERTGFLELAAEPKSLWLTDYSWPLPTGGQAPALWEGVAVSLAGLAGTAVVVVIAVLCNRLFVPSVVSRGTRGGTDVS